MFRTLTKLLDDLILLKPSWLPLLVLVPALYGIGWVLASMLTPLGLLQANVAPVGTALSLVLFLALQPRWIRLRWQLRHAWRALGLLDTARDGRPSFASAMGRGLLWACLLLSLIVVPILLGSWGHWLGEWSIGQLLDALVLTLGVGLAEELIFRGWLWGELDRLLGETTALIAQAVLFSLAHVVALVNLLIRQGALPMISLVLGLFLLGLALGLRRRLDHGSLWGAIGLHGGLVGGWFLLQGGWLQISPGAPLWLIGPVMNPTGMETHPLGGALAIVALSLLIRFQFKALAKAARP